jgi:hypothetical protein
MAAQTCISVTDVEMPLTAHDLGDAGSRSGFDGLTRFSQVITPIGPRTTGVDRVPLFSGSGSSSLKSAVKGPRNISCFCAHASFSETGSPPSASRPRSSVLDRLASRSSKHSSLPRSVEVAITRPVWESRSGAFTASEEHLAIDERWRMLPTHPFHAAHGYI